MCRHGNILILLFVSFNCCIDIQNVFTCCRRMRLEDFFPVTFRMDMKDEREAFFNGMTRLNIWTDTGDKEIQFQTFWGS